MPFARSRHTTSLSAQSPPSTTDVESLSSALSPARRDGAVKVVLRVRPFAEKEAATDFSGPTHPLLCPTRGTLEVQPAKSSVAQAFKFDHVLWSPTQCPAGVSPARQVDVFHRVGLPTLDAVLNGYNSCVLAYGQTGSGKTYTIMGREPGPIHSVLADPSGAESDALIHKGLLPRLCEALFKTASGFQDGKTAVFEVSFMEIYCEKVKDLLSAPPGGALTIRSEGSSLALNSLASTSEYKPLKVRQHPVTGVFVEGIRKETVTCWEDCRTLLTAGMKKRATASTAMNDSSSRSHAIFSLTLCTTEGACSRTARMDMVDLAGSERASKTGATGQLLDEANQINLSLAVLRKVIDALVDSKRGNTVPPFRESMLTWVLSDSLGGNSKTTIIATVSPTEDALDETVATMRYAVKARNIVNAARVNESSQSRTLREMHEELQRLRQSQARGLPAELEEARRCLDESQHTVSLLESKLGSKAPAPVLQAVEYHHVRARESHGGVCLMASEHHRVVPAVRRVVAEARNEEATCLGPCVIL